MYKAPELVLSAKRMYELPFQAIVNAASQLTIVSGLITFKFKVIQVKMFFGNDHINNVWHYWLIGRNSGGSTTTVPPDDNMFGLMSPIALFVGHNEVITAYPDFSWTEERGYIKLHINNVNTYIVTVKAICRIEEL